jgi:hypothetical protein
MGLAWGNDERLWLRGLIDMRFKTAKDFKDPGTGRGVWGISIHRAGLAAPAWEKSIGARKDAKTQRKAMRSM